MRYIVLGLLLSFVSLNTLRAVTTPFEDNRGGFPDELFHFARSLQSTLVISELMGISAPDLDANTLVKYSTRVDNICELGFEDRSACPEFFESRVNNLIPMGSGKIRGRGVYFTHGLIQLLLSDINVQSRLMIGRLFAIGIGVALIYVVYSLANLLFNDSRLAIASAALVGLMPSVSNIISAVSTEGPALLAVGLVLLAAANIALRGYSLSRLFGLVFGFLACLFTKMTAIVVLPVVILLLVLKAGFRWRWLLLTSLFGLIVVAVVYLTYVPEKAGVAYWYIERDPGEVSIHGTPAKLAHQKYTKSVHMNLEGKADNLGLWSISSSNCNTQMSIIYGLDCQGVINEPIVQFLPTNIARGLAGKTVTIGSWVAVSDVVTFRAPDILFSYDNARKDILKGKLYEAQSGWQFVSYETNIPDGVSDVAVRLHIPDATTANWEGLVLAEGSFSSSEEPPMFDNIIAVSGQWGGSRFTNLIKNGSAEKLWTGAPKVIVNLMNTYGSGTWANRLNGQLFTLHDFDRTSAGYINGLRAIFVTFWGAFAGGDWPGLARWHYVVAIGFLMLAVLGWMRYAWLHSSIKPIVAPSIALLLLLLAVLYLVVGFLRMEVSAEWSPTLYYATARFILPAIIPVVLLGLAGIELLNSKKISRLVIAALVAVVFLANTWMLLRVELPYFNCTSETRWTCTDI